MKKTLLSAVAAGALVFGAAAQAQDLGAVLSNILGIGGATTHDGRVNPDAIPPEFTGQIVMDNAGRTIYIDQYGRQMVVPGGVAYTAGRPHYRDGSGRWVPVELLGYQYGYGGYPQARYQQQDRDGDGVADANDRRPNDPRRW